MAQLDGGQILRIYLERCQIKLGIVSEHPPRRTLPIWQCDTGRVKLNHVSIGEDESIGMPDRPSAGTTSTVTDGDQGTPCRLGHSR
jgi:hypothetical protein